MQRKPNHGRAPRPWRRWQGALALATLAAFAVGTAGSTQAGEVRAVFEGSPTIDYQLYWESQPELSRLSEEGLRLATQLHEVMDRLTKTADDPVEGRAARAECKAVLQGYRAIKAQQVAMVNAILEIPKSSESDAALIRRLRDTELTGIAWNKRKFIDCLRDLARALDVDIVMHPNVLKFNTVEMTFPRMSADGILTTICNACESEYIVYDGEIVVIKRIKRNDERLQRYLDKHPEWKYWQPETGDPSDVIPDDEED